MSARTLLDANLKLDAQFLPATITTSVVAASNVIITNNNVVSEDAQLSLINEADVPTTWRVWNTTQPSGGLTGDGTLEFWSYNDDTDRRPFMMNNTGEVFLGDPGATNPLVYVSGTVSGAGVEGRIYDAIYNPPLAFVGPSMPPYTQAAAPFNAGTNLSYTFVAPKTGWYMVSYSLQVGASDTLTAGEVVEVYVQTGTGAIAPLSSQSIAVSSLFKIQGDTAYTSGTFLMYLTGGTGYISQMALTTPQATSVLTGAQYAVVALAP